MLVTGTVHAQGPRHELSIPDIEVDVVGDVDGTHPAPQKVLQDTVWIADWTFDATFPCDDSGWMRVDNRILNDGVVHWRVTGAFTGTGGISGNAATLGYNATPSCIVPNGYANNWHQAIRITYTGLATLSFDYLLDSESGGDFLRIETDSACVSFDRVDYDIAPNKVAASFRAVELAASGLDLGGTVLSEPLADYGPGTHCAYIAFFSNDQFSPCDGSQATTIGEAVVIDDITITDSGGTRSEDFEDGTLDLGTFLNIQDSEPFGAWARTFLHVTDNELCGESTTCSWLWTDHTTPTVANDPSMAFGPGSYVVRNWLDDIIVSPWVSIASTPNAQGTLLQFRRFGGNFFATSRIVQNWSVRSRSTVNSQTQVSGWGHAFQWNSLDLFGWISVTFPMTGYFDPTATEIQVRFRTADWQWIMGATPPSPFNSGPGPYLDRVRIGRGILSGPVINEGIDARSQAQDAFSTVIFPTGAGTGEHYQPSTDRFGSCAFSMGQDAGIHHDNLITGDSIWVNVVDVRGAGGVATVDLYGTIASGPHAGKAPAPWQVGANGFFLVPAQNPSLPTLYFVDLDDTYFRGSDVLHYFWLAADALGGITSDPVGLTAVPTSKSEAEVSTGGLLEVSFLPTINWDPAYSARIAADPHGDLDPTPAEIATSSQKNCILYVQMVNRRRRTGDINRTSFMYTLDRLGYRGDYDVYDFMGLGDTNNHPGGRATIEQAQGYSLIVYDAGNMSPVFIMPDGSVRDSQKIDQATWFRNWLAQAGTSEAGFATLWILGSNVLQEKPTAALYNTDMGVVLNTTNQGLSLNPDVDGVASFTFDRGTEQATVDFGTNFYSLNGGCPTIRDYDGLGATGSGVVTHKYRDPISGTTGDAAIVMNRNDPESWNTILQSHPWFDIWDPQNNVPAPLDPKELLMQAILNGTLRTPCIQQLNPTDTADPRDVIDLQPVTALHQNVPNPFNPVSTIRFDLARKGKVSLRIYDVAGHLVRTLLHEERPAGRNQSIVWDGKDQEDRLISSGIYLYRLKTAEAALTRKMLVIR